VRQALHWDPDHPVFIFW